MDETYECKRLKYAELVAADKHCGWRVRIHQVEVDCSGFVAMSTTREFVTRSIVKPSKLLPKDQPVARDDETSKRVKLRLQVHF